MHEADEHDFASGGVHGAGQLQAKGDISSQHNTFLHYGTAIQHAMLIHGEPAHIRDLVSELITKVFGVQHVVGVILWGDGRASPAGRSTAGVWQRVDKHAQFADPWVGVNRVDVQPGLHKVRTSRHRPMLQEDLRLARARKEVNRCTKSDRTAVHQ